MRADDCISRTRAIERLKLNLPISQGADNSKDRHRYMQAMADIQAIREMPSVTPQLSSELEKNSKKLENPTSKNDSEVDCVSRQFMYDLGATCIAYRNDKQELIPIISIDELPSVTPQEPRWIPVSEKLPNDRDWYLGIFKESDTGWINPLPFICDYVGSETKATTKEYWILRGFTDMDEHIDYYFNLECVAWMPLPEPCREVEE